MEERKDINTQRTTSSISNVQTTRGAAVVIPVIEEQATICKKEIETGTVRVERVVSEHTEPVHVIVTHDECQVEHVAAGYYVDAAPETRWEGDTMIIPVLKEVAVVEKKLLLVEELHITRKAVQTQHTEQVTLRKERIQISRNPTDGTSSEAL